MTDRRDFKGYFGAEPAPCWPNAARLTVSFVVNVEEGAELSIADGDERNESTYEIREEIVGHPDPCMETHFAYGTRQGYGRIANAFDTYGVKATFSTCGRAVYDYVNDCWQPMPQLENLSGFDRDTRSFAHQSPPPAVPPSPPHRP